MARSVEFKARVGEPAQLLARVRAIARDLMRQLGIGDDQLVDRAYVDLLACDAR